MSQLSDIIKFLELQVNYKIEMQSGKNKKMSGGYWAQYYKGKLNKHLIRVYMGNFDESSERDYYTVIVHELIHAWQEEQGHKDIHGESFQYMAAKVGYVFGIKKLYIPEYDTP